MNKKEGKQNTCF